MGASIPGGTNRQTIACVTLMGMSEGLHGWAGTLLEGIAPLAAQTWPATCASRQGAYGGEVGDKPGFVYSCNPDDGREDLGASDEMVRVVRGGSFSDNQRDVRCTCRTRSNPDLKYRYDGFRLLVALVPYES